MDTRKFLLIAIYALLLSLTFQMFLGKKDNTPAVTTNNVILEIQKDTTIIPNLPVISIHNTTSGSQNFETCRDMSITQNSVVLSDIEKVAPTFCQSMSVGSNEKKQISFQALSKVFSSDMSPGKYIVTLKTPLGDRSVSFTHEKPGMFRSLGSTLIYEPIYNLLVGLIKYLPGHSLGWAILIITIIIRLILLVPQHHMLVNQKKLQAIQPKIKAIQEEFKGDQAVLGQKMLELYKKEGVNPMGSCLPIFIQMPILIGLYWVISSISDTSNFYHLYPFFRDFNVEFINPDFYGLHLNNMGGTIGIIFALVLAVTQWAQAKLSFVYNPTPKKPKKTDDTATTPEAMLDPEVMQKMMLYVLPVMIGVSSYFFPLGVGLYWFVGTLFVIAQQFYVNKLKGEKKVEIVKRGE